MTWWKWLAILLVTYAIVAGILVPLKPGLISVNQNSFLTDAAMEMEVEGYNTSFASHPEQTRAWIKLETPHILEAVSTEVISDDRLRILFITKGYVPGNLPITPASIIVHHPKDGTMVLPRSISLRRSGEGEGTSMWTTERPEVFESKKGFFFPYRNILVETIRNIYYHVAIWFAMFIILLISVIRSIQYLRTRQLDYDAESDALVKVGILFGLIGIATGALWAKFTWGTYWTTDVKLNMAAVSMLIYLGYLLLRASVADRERKATLAASYSIFAYLAMIPLLFIVPRMTDSLHPGNGGNPALGGEDLDHTMRMVFYPAIIGFTLTGLWMAQLKWRLEKLFLRKLGL